MKTVPIKFKGTDCPACGSKDSIRYIGRNSKAVEDINETMLGSYEVKCMNCDHKYILKWNMQKYMLMDMAKKFDGFLDNYMACDLRDVALTMAKQYELPSNEEIESIFEEKSQTE